jgi:hypothetical protein
MPPTGPSPATFLDIVRALGNRRRCRGVISDDDDEGGDGPDGPEGGRRAASANWRGPRAPSKTCACVWALVRETGAMPYLALQRIAAAVLPVGNERATLLKAMGEGRLVPLSIVGGWNKPECVRVLEGVVELAPARAVIPRPRWAHRPAA